MTKTEFDIVDRFFYRVRFMVKMELIFAAIFCVFLLVTRLFHFQNGLVYTLSSTTLFSLASICVMIIIAGDIFMTTTRLVMPRKLLKLRRGSSIT